MNLAEIQEQIRAQQLDGWLFFDHHQSRPDRLSGALAESLHARTRRWYYWIPAAGEPRKLVHRIEARNAATRLPGERKIVYSGWTELRSGSSDMLAGASRIAMQFSPDCMIPYVSLVDGGTVDLVQRPWQRGRDVRVDWCNISKRVGWPEQLESHYFAGG